MLLPMPLPSASWSWGPGGVSFYKYQAPQSSFAPLPPRQPPAAMSRCVKHRGPRGGAARLKR